MKKILTLLAVAVALLTTVPAQAQVKFGLKGGVNVTNMSFSSEVLDATNRAGFFIGPTVKFTLPKVTRLKWKATTPLSSNKSSSLSISVME